MEYYFSGTIERIILKIPVFFFESSCSTLAIPMPKTLMILSYCDGHHGRYHGRRRLHPSGELVHHPKYGEQLKISRYERPNPLARA